MDLESFQAHRGYAEHHGYTLPHAEVDALEAEVGNLGCEGHLLVDLNCLRLGYGVGSKSKGAGTGT